MIVRYVVPWRPDGGARDKLWAFCRQMWAREVPEANWAESPSPKGPFNRAAAINAGARGAWDVLVVADADVFVAGEQLREAIARAYATEHFTLPYSVFCGLNKETTEAVLAGTWRPGQQGIRYRSINHVSSILAIPRAVWDGTGGFDERFIGWGCEDVEFARRAGVKHRIEGIVWHLWHPNSPDKRRGATYRRNRDLLAGRA